MHCGKTKCPRAPSRIFEVMEKNHVPVPSEGQISPMLDKLVWVSTWTSYSQLATFWSPTTAKWIQADEFVRPSYDWLCECSKRKRPAKVYFGGVFSWHWTKGLFLLLLEYGFNKRKKVKENRNAAGRGHKHKNQKARGDSERSYLSQHVPESKVNQWRFWWGTSSEVKWCL